MALLEKEKVKKKMHEFIVDSYWTKTAVQFKDVKEKFGAPPIMLSEGSVANYLDELIEARKIQKWRAGVNVYYGPPQISMPVKMSVGVTITCLGIIAIFLLFGRSIPTLSIQSIKFDLSIWYIILPAIGFNFGVIIMGFFWRRAEKSLNSKKQKA